MEPRDSVHRISIRGAGFGYEAHIKIGYPSLKSANRSVHLAVGVLTSNGVSKVEIDRIRQIRNEKLNANLLA